MLDIKSDKYLQMLLQHSAIEDSLLLTGVIHGAIKEIQTLREENKVLADKVDEFRQKLSPDGW